MSQENLQLRIWLLSEDGKVDMVIWSSDWFTSWLEEKNVSGWLLGWRDFLGLSEQHSEGGPDHCSSISWISNPQGTRLYLDQVIWEALFLFVYSESDFSTPHYQSIRPNRAENVLLSYLRENQDLIDQARTPVLQETFQESRLEMSDGSLTSVHSVLVVDDSR